MKVYFIGAGPGAPDLITVRGARILGQVPMVMYAGSLVSQEMLQHCKPQAEIIDTSGLNLEEQVACYVRAQEKNWEVARVHSGDPAIYGATAEQMRRLDKLGIDYEVIPGVSSFLAAAAILKTELTKPDLSQTIIITRTNGRASQVPERESLASLAAHGCTLSIFLSGARMEQLVADLLVHYPPDTPVALVQKATWPEEKVHQGLLSNLLQEVTEENWSLSTMMLVGPVLRSGEARESQLYAKDYAHLFRNKATAAARSSR